MAAGARDDGGGAGCDRRMVAGEAARTAAAAQFLAAADGGVRGMVQDYALSARPWGFALSEIQAEVHVFHGVRDALVPVDHALALAAGLPRCRAWMDPEEGHFLFRRRLADVLGAVTGAGATSGAATPHRPEVRGAPIRGPVRPIRQDACP